MLRIVYQSMFSGILLSACAVWTCAEVAQAQTGAAAGNKQMYSNRPLGYSAPPPYYGTPMAPRFAAPPPVPTRVPVVHANMTEFSPAVPITTESSVFPQQVVEETIVVRRDRSPEVSVSDELDTFYARLAKIQLEKHQLAETLALIQKIKSETFKVRTIVSLAEFVSRDKNYQSEAEQLYRLALASIDALDKKEPFRMDVDTMKDTTQQPRLAEPVVTPSRRSPNPAPVPISAPEPVFQPKTDQNKPQPVELPDDVPTDSTKATERNGNGKHLSPPPPPTEDLNDIVVLPPSGNRQFGLVLPPASPAETKISLPESVVKPPAGISLEEEEESEKVVPKPAETKVETPAPAQRPREPRRPRSMSIVIPEEN